MGRITLLLFSLFSSTLSIVPQAPKGQIDVHFNVDVAETSFDFASEWLTMQSVVTLAWIDKENPYIPKKNENVTHSEGEFEWPLGLQFSDMWIPPIKNSIEQNEYRKSLMKLTEVTFERNGGVTAKYFYTAVIPCSQASLFFPWDDYHCGIFINNMEDINMYTLSAKNREKPFNISYSRPMNQHRITDYDSNFRSSFARAKDRTYRTHGVLFECVVERDQPRIIYSNVIPTLSLIFFDVYLYINNRTSPLYNLLVAIPLIIQIQFFSKLLVNKLPYLVILLISRTFLTILTSLGRLLLTILDQYFPDEVKRVRYYDILLHRILFLIASTAFLSLAIDHTL